MTFSVRSAITDEDKAACYQLRHEVFVDEQNVPVEMEIDAHDETDAEHFLGCLNNQPAAAGRLVFLLDYVKLGRLVVAKQYRGNSYGAIMMTAMIQHAASKRQKQKLVLDAQIQALKFYEKLGFHAVGPQFLDAGIPHRRMELNL